MRIRASLPRRFAIREDAQSCIAIRVRHGGGSRPASLVRGTRQFDHCRANVVDALPQENNFLLVCDDGRRRGAIAPQGGHFILEFVAAPPRHIERTLQGLAAGPQALDLFIETIFSIAYLCCQLGLFRQ